MTIYFVIFTIVFLYQNIKVIFAREKIIWKIINYYYYFYDINQNQRIKKNNFLQKIIIFVKLEIFYMHKYLCLVRFERLRSGLTNYPLSKGTLNSDLRAVLNTTYIVFTEPIGFIKKIGPKISINKKK